MPQTHNTIASYVASYHAAVSSKLEVLLYNRTMQRPIWFLMEFPKGSDHEVIACYLGLYEEG